MSQRPLLVDRSLRRRGQAGTTWPVGPVPRPPIAIAQRHALLNKAYLHLKGRTLENFSFVVMGIEDDTTSRESIFGSTGFEDTRLLRQKRSICLERHHVEGNIVLPSSA